MPGQADICLQGLVPGYSGYHHQTSGYNLAEVPWQEVPCALLCTRETSACAHSPRWLQVRGWHVAVMRCLLPCAASSGPYGSLSLIGSADAKLSQLSKSGGAVPELQEAGDHPTHGTPALSTALERCAEH